MLISKYHRGTIIIGILEFTVMQILSPRVVKVEDELTAELSTQSSMNGRGIETTETNLKLS